MTDQSGRSMDIPSGNWVHHTPYGIEHGGASPSGKGPSAIEAFLEALATTWHTRQTLWMLIVHDFKSRYRAQSLGMFWSFANPLIMMATLTVAFVYILRINIPYFPIFYLTAHIFWHFFSSSVGAATGCLVSRSGLVKRTSFPRFLIPVMAVASQIINFGLEAIVLFLFVFVYPGAYNFTITLVALPLLVLLVAILAIGLGLITSVLNVKFRDMEYIVGSILLMGFWVSPIIYSTSMAPSWMTPILRLNPMAGILEGARDIVMQGRWPNPAYLTPTLIGAPTVFVIGCFVFRKGNLDVADYV